jgi:hypothetical protein
MAMHKAHDFSSMSPVRYADQRIIWPGTREVLHSVLDVEHMNRENPDLSRDYQNYLDSRNQRPSALELVAGAVVYYDPVLMTLSLEDILR